MGITSGLFSTNGLRNRGAWVVGVFAIALLVRLAMLGTTFRGNDTVAYYDDAQIALNLVAGNGYSVIYQYRNWLLYEAVLKTAKLDAPVVTGTRTTALKQPAYALILAGLLSCCGAKNFLLVFLLQATISALTVSLLFWWLRSISPFTALAVAVGASIYPAFVFHAVTVPESTTLTLLLIAVLWCSLTRLKETPSLRLWTFGAAIGGLAVLTEPVTLPFVGLWCCYAFYLDSRRLKTRLVGIVAAGAVIFLVVSPWLIRNYVVFGRFPVFKSGATGHIFNWGLHFSGKGSWISEDRLVALEKAGRAMSELEEEEAIQHELVSGFRNHWREYVTDDMPRNFVHLWWDIPRYWSNYSLSYLLGRRGPYVLLLLLACPSILRIVGSTMPTCAGVISSSTSLTSRRFSSAAPACTSKLRLMFESNWP